MSLRSLRKFSVLKETRLHTRKWMQTISYFTKAPIGLRETKHVEETLANDAVELLY